MQVISIQLKYLLCEINILFGSLSFYRVSVYSMRLFLDRLCLNKGFSTDGKILYIVISHSRKKDLIVRRNVD